MEQTVYQNWRALIKPRRVERDSKSDPSYGKFVIRPLERGFGDTIGNALRRILLSSLQGAAITTVTLDGVLHEFAFIPGIVEDVTDIVLNFKGVLLRTSSTDVVKGRIHRKGEPGTTVELSPVLVVDGAQLTTDADALAKVAVTGEVVEHTKGPKIRIHKFKNKTGYHKRQGHRQPLTRVQVTGIAK